MLERTLSKARVAVGVGLLSCATCGPASREAEAAGKPYLSLGEISVAIDVKAEAGGLPALGRSLRSALDTELSRVSNQAQSERPLIVSARLTRLSCERRAERSRASATIALAVRRAEDHVLFAELSGRASVEEEASDWASLRRAALQAAVRGALARLPEALQRSR